MISQTESQTSTFKDKTQGSSYNERVFKKIKTWLQGLSFRTGVIVLLSCIPFYIISFAQMLLPISTGAKTVLWVIFFGLAKTAQYGGLTILGVEGYRRLKNYFKKHKNREEQP